MVGDGAEGIARGALAAGADPGTVSTVPDVDAAHALLTQELSDGDVVLLKSSRDSGLRFLGDRIVEEAGKEVGR